MVSVGPRVPMVLRGLETTGKTKAHVPLKDTDPTRAHATATPRSFRFGLRSVFFATAVISCGLAVYAHRKNMERRAQAKIRELGGTFTELNRFVDDRGRYFLSLDLSGSRVTDDDLSQFDWLPLVHALNLSDTGVSNAGLAKLRHRTDFRELQLDRTNVSDQGLGALTNMRRLARLHLRGTPVTDQGLSHLNQLEKLWFVDLRDTLVSEEGVRRLRTSMPQATISWNDRY